MAVMNREATKMTMDAVQGPRYLLGIADEEITANNRHLVTWNTSKIGGGPDFMRSDATVPRCRLCGVEMTLVVQVYAPLDDDHDDGAKGHTHRSDYHRTLYVFNCIGCWRRTWISSSSSSSSSASSSSTSTARMNCWHVLRSQLPVSADDESLNEGTIEMAATDWLDSADDWGAMDEEDVVVVSRSPRILPSDAECIWGMETSRVVGGGDERLTNKVNLDVDEQGNTTRQIRGYVQCSSSVSSDEDDRGNDDDDNDDSLSGRVRSKLHLSDSVEGAVGLSQDCEAELEPPDDDATSVAIAVDTPSLPSRELIDALFTSNKTTSVVDRAIVLRSWFLAVVEEPRPSPVDKSGRCRNVAFGDHERELLASYQRQEGMNINELYSRSQRTETSGGGESYEKCVVRHGDREFQKLQRRLRLVPQQLLRYCRDSGASPLLVSSATKGDECFDAAGLRCSNCGGDMVFELQILPTAVDFMKQDKTQETVLEFGTVVIYTCRVSCWPPNATRSVVVEERAIAVSDPDEAFFDDLKRRSE